MRPPDFGERIFLGIFFNPKIGSTSIFLFLYTWGLVTHIVLPLFVRDFDVIIRGGPAVVTCIIVLDLTVALHVGVIPVRRLVSVAIATCVVVMRIVSMLFNVMV
jgi:hypothetical protein